MDVTYNTDNDEPCIIGYVGGFYYTPEAREKMI